MEKWVPRSLLQHETMANELELDAVQVTVNHLANSHKFFYIFWNPLPKKRSVKQYMVLLIFMRPEVGQACIILSGL